MINLIHNLKKGEGKIEKNIRGFYGYCHPFFYIVHKCRGGRAVGGDIERQFGTLQPANKIIYR